MKAEQTYFQCLEITKCTTNLWFIVSFILVIITTRAKAAKHYLFSVINSHSLPLKIRLYTNKTYIRSILTYAAPTLGSNIFPSKYKTLELIQSTTLRSITGQPWFASNQATRISTNTLTIQNEIKKHSDKLKQKILTTHHDHLKNIATRSHLTCRRHNRPITFWIRNTKPLTLNNSLHITFSARSTSLEKSVLPTMQCNGFLLI